MDPSQIDQIRLNFNPQSLTALNVLIGLMMFGMALDIRLDDFRRVIRSPRGPLIGLGAQFVLLPAFTFLLTLVLEPAPSMALGMILVAACPGGNLSNVMTYLANGNTALSVSMTAVSTAAAVLMTPLNLSLWGGLNPATATILKQVSLSPLDVLGSIVMILGLPLAAGIFVARRFPGLTAKVRKPFKIFSVVVFLCFIGGALAANWSIFMRVIGLVVLVVMAHNALALGLGYGAGRLARLPRRDVRAVSIEVGLQNSALGLVLVFNFFDGLGGMAILTAWWGVWHIIAGLTLATIWSRTRLPDGADVA